MEELFKKLNDNSTIMMYSTIIDEVIKEDKQNQMKAIQDFFLKMKMVDKNVLNDKNLGVLEALEFFFEDKKIDFSSKSKRYKKYFLKMLSTVYQHESLYEFNDNHPVLLTIDEETNDINLQYEDKKLCDRKNNSLAIANIHELQNISPDKLMDKYNQYKMGEIPCDLQVLFVLESYLKTIELSTTYLNDVQNWSKQIVVYGNVSSYYVKQFYDLDKIVLDYFDELMTQRVQADLKRNDVVVHAFIDGDNQFSLLITKQHKKQKNKNM